MSLLRTKDRALVIAASACVTLALGMRLWSLTWGLPFDYHPDEHVVVDTAVMMVSSGQLDPEWYHWPSGLFYLELLPVTVLHHVRGVPLEVLSGPGITPGMMPLEQVGYLFSGRLLVAIAGALTALVVAIGARRLGGGLIVPLVAGLLTALAPLHVRHSHYLTPDIPMTLGVALALVAALGLLSQPPRWRRALLAGAMVGLAAGFKYTGAVAFIPVLAAIALATASVRHRLLLAGLALLGAIAVFAALTPAALTQPGAVLDGLLFDAKHYYVSGHPGHTSDESTFALIRHLVDERAVGLVAVLLAALSAPLLVLRWVRDRYARAVIVLFAFVIAYLALFAAVRADFERSALPLVPALSLLAASTVGGLRSVLRGRLVARLVTLAVALLLSPIALAGGQASWSLGLERTETRAHDWFVSTVPPGARVLTEWYGPHLSPERYQVLANASAGDWHLDSLSDTHADYIVLSSVMFRRFVAPANEADRHRYAVYDAIFARPPAAVFCPTPGQVTGPDIWVFARSERAQRLHSSVLIEGACRGDWPWLGD